MLAFVVGFTVLSFLSPADGGPERHWKSVVMAEDEAPGEDEDDESGAEGEAEEEEPTGERESFLECWGFGFDADLEFADERQGGESTSELTLDEVGIHAGREWWEAEAAIKYESEGRGLILEEGALRVGATKKFPGFAKAGRTGLPFGESETRFGEDPLAVVIGEQFDDTLVLGFESEDWEIAAGAFRTELSENDVGVSMSARFQGESPWAIGISWTSELGESAEVRELRRDRVEELLLSGAARDAVRGFGAALSLDVRRAAVIFEYVAALDDFDAAVLDEDTRSPAAWNTEFTFRPAKRWQLTSRFEASDDLPESPSRQYGVAAAYKLSALFELSAEYLRGDFEDAPDRDLIGAKVAFEY